MFSVSSPSSCVNRACSYSKCSAFRAVLTGVSTARVPLSRPQVFSIFLESVQELVVQHSADLDGWLRLLVARLLTKVGGDLLGSVVQKIERTLDVVR